MAALTCFVGLHYGHIIVHFKVQVFMLFNFIISWLIFSFPYLITGLKGQTSARDPGLESGRLDSAVAGTSCTGLPFEQSNN